MGQLNMKRISLLELLQENQGILSAQEIIDYITRITPDESDVPDYFFSKMLKSNKKFKKKLISITDLLRQDQHLKGYVDSKTERYGADQEGEYEPHWEELDNPIVVFDGEVVDGYSRVATHVKNGEDRIYGYVSQ
jgi:hypothetical protein